MQWQTTFRSMLALPIALWGVALQAQEAPSAAPRPVVAIMDFTNGALIDHEAYEPARAGIAGLLLSELRQNPDIELVERERIREVLSEIGFGQSGQVDAATAARAGRLLGAQRLIVGVFMIDPSGELRIDARTVNVETSRVEHAETVSDDADNLLQAVQRLGGRLAATLALPVDVPAQDVQADRQERILANLKYARALLEEDRENDAGAVRLYREFLMACPAGHAIELRQRAEERVRILTPVSG